MNKSPAILRLFFVSIIILITLLGPAEANLGKNARLVYLHGAWVWTSLTTFIASGLVGMIGFVVFWLDRKVIIFHQWSRALSRTGLLFWITYLPVSLWAMETNWNGLFLAEPRWRLAIIFAVAGFLLQLGLSLVPVAWSSFFNPAYILTLFLFIRQTETVMHPINPLQSEAALRIQLFFGVLTILLIVASWQLASWFKSHEDKVIV